MRACRATHVSLHLFASPLTAHSAFEATPLRMVHDRPVFLISWHGYTPFQGCLASPVMVRSRSCHVAAPGIGGTPGDATRGRPARRVQGNWNSWCPFGCPPRLDKNNRPDRFCSSSKRPQPWRQVRAGGAWPPSGRGSSPIAQRSLPRRGRGRACRRPRNHLQRRAKVERRGSGPGPRRARSSCAM